MPGPSPFPPPEQIFLDRECDTRLDPGFHSASGSGGVGNAEEAKVKKTKTKGSSMETIRGVFPAPSTPKKMAADKYREN